LAKHAFEELGDAWDAIFFMQISPGLIGLAVLAVLLIWLATSFNQLVVQRALAKLVGGNRRAANLPP
jgi:hypothetical protein